jgi:hypothetical protein
MTDERPEIRSVVPAQGSVDHELPLELRVAWEHLWVNRAVPYATQQADGTYRWVYAPCDTALLVAHLRGDITLAVSSSDECGRCRWLCLDADGLGTVPQLLALRAALAVRGLPGVVEASRRGGHLWLVLEAPVSAAAARTVLMDTLPELQAAGTDMPEVELYPDAGAAVPGALGHAVRLPLGVHRITGQRYPLFDPQGNPCAFTSAPAALRYVLALPRISATRMLASDGPRPASASAVVSDATPARAYGQVGTRSAVIRWVDAHVGVPDLLSELAPLVELRPVGRGYLGWCPFHDDRAPDAAGRPGTPSFYAVHDPRYGWSWRCFSINCVHSQGLIRHSFRLLQELLELTPAQAIREACARWPAAETQSAGDTNTTGLNTACDVLREEGDRQHDETVPD